MRIHDEWLLTPQRIAVHEPTSTAVIADLHLGYCEARRQGGDSVPLLGVDDLLAPLHVGMSETGARRLVIAGDLFEKTFVLPIWNQLTRSLATRDIELAAV